MDQGTGHADCVGMFNRMETGFRQLYEASEFFPVGTFGEKVGGEYVALNNRGDWTSSGRMTPRFMRV